MNFIDDLDGSTLGSQVNTTERNSSPDQSLNEEVTQMIGQLGKFWGGFRKQSQNALEIARKDLGQVVAQAQKEIGKFTAEVAQPSTSRSGTTETAAPEGATSEDIPVAGPSSSSSSSSAENTPSTSTSPSTSQTFFARLQSSLPPNITNVIQNNIPDTLKDASGNLNLAAAVDFTHLRAELQRVQGVTRAQAEEYIHRSEALFREAGEFLKDAVKVVPPDPQAGVVWDGSDVWMLPSYSVEAVRSGSRSGSGSRSRSEHGGRRSASLSGRASGEMQRAAATRADALLKKLRYDPGVVRIDPEGDERVGLVYAKWVKDEVEGKEGGIGGVYWAELRKSALDDGVGGEVLKSTLDTLVPAEMTEQVFWTRYFFRVHQIEQDEERRKALLQGAIQKDEDFSWEDEDEEPGSAGPNGEPSRSRASLNTLKPADTVIAPVRDSSSEEGSYDVVSSNVSTSGESEAKEKEKEKEKEKKKKKQDDEGDSDWE